MTEQELPKNATFLKAVVVILGILILICLAIIIGAVIKRMIDKPGEAAIEQPLQAPQTIQSGSYFETIVTLEKGEKILSSHLSDDKILITIMGPDGTPRMVLIDRKGKQLGTIRFSEVK